MKVVNLSLLIFFLLIRSANAGLIGGELKFSGRVNALPCDVISGDEIIPVNFNDVSLKELLVNKKSKRIPFTIHLINCNTDVYKTVTVVFSGAESAKLPNHLAITPKISGSNMSAVAVGLQLENGTPIILNEETPAQALSGNSKNLKFMAYIEGISAELRQGQVDFGEFTSVASYTLNYQ